jgi:hypothetical protein
VAITFGSVVASTVRRASTGLVTFRAKLVGMAVVAIDTVEVGVFTRVLAVTITSGRVQTDTVLSVTLASGASWTSMSDSTFVAISSERSFLARLCAVSVSSWNNVAAVSVQSITGAGLVTVGSVELGLTLGFSHAHTVTLDTVVAFTMDTGTFFVACFTEISSLARFALTITRFAIITDTSSAGTLLARWSKVVLIADVTAKPVRGVGKRC